jgi:hypothetical protein
LNAGCWPLIVLQKMKTHLPQTLVEKQRAAGRARQALLSPEERKALGRLAWKKRIAKYRVRRVMPVLP